MTQTLELIAVGDGLGIKLTPEMLEKLNGRAGHTVTVALTNDGVELRKTDDTQAKIMEIARQVMRENRDVLRRLAE